MREFILLAIIVIVIPHGVKSLDENSVKEFGCTIPARDSKDVGLDLQWMGSIKTFYVPLWSKLYSYRVASDLLEKDVESISEGEVARPTCLLFKENNEIHGLGQVRTFNINGSETGLTWRAQWPGAKSGKYVFHLTDNKSFVLGINCWEDNQSGWTLLSTTPTVYPQVKKRVLNYLTSQGFSSRLAKEENYDTCPGVNVPRAFNHGGLPVVRPVVPTVEYILLYPAYQPSYYYPLSEIGYGWKK